MDWIESEMAMVSTKAIKLSISLILFLINLVTYDLVLGYQMYWELSLRLYYLAEC